MHSNIFDVAELERLRREAVPSSGENAAAEDAAPHLAEQTANVDAAVYTPVVVDSNDDGTIAQELEEYIGRTRTRANEEYIGRGDCGYAQYASRKLTATSPHSPKQAESGCREGSEPNAGDLFGSKPGPLRDGLNSFWRRRHRLHKSLERPIVSGTGLAPNQADTVAFWRSLWSEPVNHSEGPWTEVVVSQVCGYNAHRPRHHNAG
ncbi:unnamed protein product [Parnassius apollo]|uniref:(apollo) hypothetical protein n=1 Tax=Parnassius apollo TaxID=110799 RepID=A0A8S3WD57_PARAO|nr:unnamed protein product [Parnassius apollo]